MSAVPACLLSVRQSALLSKFGDMEAVSGDADLCKELLQLPLPAMEQLLSSDKLKVSRETTGSLQPTRSMGHTQQWQSCDWTGRFGLPPD